MFFYLPCVLSHQNRSCRLRLTKPMVRQCRGYGGVRGAWDNTLPRVGIAGHPDSAVILQKLEEEKMVVEFVWISCQYFPATKCLVVFPWDVCSSYLGILMISYSLRTALLLSRCRCSPSCLGCRSCPAYSFCLFAALLNRWHGCTVIFTLLLFLHIFRWSLPSTLLSGWVPVESTTGWHCLGVDLLRSVAICCRRNGCRRDAACDVRRF